jgi:5,6,7,8-tetrahydromethanopterin hydro-lyase
MYVGESLVGEGNEIAHIDLMIGSKDGPVGTAFANALATQSSGHTNLLAVLAPNVAVKPSTVMITKVTIKGMKQAVQMIKGVCETEASGGITRNQLKEIASTGVTFISAGALTHSAQNIDLSLKATK